MLLKQSNISKKIIFIVIAFSILLRLFFVFIAHPPEKYLYSDMQGYYERAVKFAVGEKEDIYDSFYPPATHIIYSVFIKTKDPFFWIKSFNVFISIATCFFIYLIAKDIFSRQAGYIAFTIASFNYLFIDFAGYLMSETCFTFMLAFMFYCFLKSIMARMQINRWLFSILAGLSIIVAGAIKSSVLLFIPLFGLWWVFNFKKYKIFFNLAFYVAGFLPFFILLALRFHSLTCEYGVISSNGGFNFFQGRSHIKDARFVDKKRGVEYLFASPVAVCNHYTYNDSFQTGPYDSKFFYGKGIEEAKKNIPRTIYYSLDNLYDLFLLPDVWPSFAIEKPFSILIKTASILFILFVLLPSLIILIICFRFLLKELRVLIFFPILTILITSVVFYGDPRFRIPYDVFFIVLAGYFYTEANKKLKKWYSKRLINQNQLHTYYKNIFYFFMKSFLSFSTLVKL